MSSISRFKKIFGTLVRDLVIAGDTHFRTKGSSLQLQSETDYSQLHIRSASGGISQHASIRLTSNFDGMPAELNLTPGSIRNTGYVDLVIQSDQRVTMASKFGYSGVAKVTQATSITTAVTLNALSGKIFTVSTPLAANTSYSFVVNNSLAWAGDLVIVNTQQPGTGAVGIVANGSLNITLFATGAAIASAPHTLTFAIIRATDN